MLIQRECYKTLLPKLNSLFEKSFNRNCNAKILKWRYLDNPNNELLVAVEFAEDEIVSNYSASPCIMVVDGQLKKTALSMTTMTDPQYHGKGLFVKLANELYDYMISHCYHFVMGFPNSLSHRTFINKLDWFDVYEIPTFIFNLSRLKNGKLNPGLESDNCFSGKYDNRFIVNEKYYVYKNNAYLKWRYEDNPVNSYVNYVISNNGNVSSYLVVKDHMNSLDIVDFQAVDSIEGMELLKQAIFHAQDKNFKYINCWAPRHHFMHTICEKLGFINNGPITYLGFKPLEGNNISDNYSDWYIQLGDSDVY